MLSEPPHHELRPISKQKTPKLQANLIRSLDEADSIKDLKAAPVTKVSLHTYTPPYMNNTMIHTQRVTLPAISTSSSDTLSTHPPGAISLRRTPTNSELQKWRVRSAARTLRYATNLCKHITKGASPINPIDIHPPPYSALCYYIHTNAHWTVWPLAPITTVKNLFSNLPSEWNDGCIECLVAKDKYYIGKELYIRKVGDGIIRDIVAFSEGRVIMEIEGTGRRTGHFVYVSAERKYVKLNVTKAIKYEWHQWGQRQKESAMRFLENM